MGGKEKGGPWMSGEILNICTLFYLLVATSTPSLLAPKYVELGPSLGIYVYNPESMELW